MNFRDTGHIFKYLLDHRRLETFSARRRGPVDEKSMALTLRDAAPDERSQLEAMLVGAGFDLSQFNFINTPGLPPGGDVFLVTRRLDQPGESQAERSIEERMQVRNDTVTQRRIWFCQLWMVHLHLLYTRRDRGPSEVSRYIETTFMRGDLVHEMREYINNLVRKLDRNELADDTVYACLTSESGTQLEAYAERFLNLMTEATLLDRVEEDKYRQSLVAAAEIRNNYLQGLEPIFLQLRAGSSPLELGRAHLTRSKEG
jgi:hypothetical protein